MSDHPNAARIRGLFAAFRERDINAIQEALAPDAVWHFPGRDGQLAGSHEGLDGILTFLIKVTELTGDTFHLEVEDVIANDKFAVAFFRGSGQRNGRTLDNPTCLKIRLEDGRAVEIFEFVWNLYEVDEFWS